MASCQERILLRRPGKSYSCMLKEVGWRLTLSQFVPNICSMWTLLQSISPRWPFTILSLSEFELPRSPQVSSLTEPLSSDPSLVFYLLVFFELTLNFLALFSLMLVYSLLAFSPLHCSSGLLRTASCFFI